MAWVSSRGDDNPGVLERLSTQCTTCTLGKTAGPPGLRVNVIYKANNIVYAGTETQGVYKSNDNGLSWIAANSGIERTSISDIIVSGGNLLIGERRMPHLAKRL